MIYRVPLLRKLSAIEQEVVQLVGQGHNYFAAGEKLLYSARSIETHAYRIAQAIPGDLPSQMKIVMWYRGAPLEVLDGTWAQQEGTPRWSSDSTLYSLKPAEVPQ